MNAGIDVYTTVNVQHIESLCDVVASITEVFVRERIPDSLFDNADQVELVDIEPQELSKYYSEFNWQGCKFTECLHDKASRRLRNFVEISLV